MLFLRNTPVDVLRYLPDFLAEDKSFKHVQDGLSKEHEQLRLRLAKLADQLFIPTAGEEGISSWERVIGLIPRADESPAPGSAPVAAIQPGIYCGVYAQAGCQILS